MPEETLQILLPSVQVNGIDLRKRLLTPEWNDYLAKARTDWVKQNINNPKELFDPQKVKTRTSLTDADWEYIYSKHPEYFDPAGKYYKQVPDKYLSRQFNKGIRDATSEAAPIILPWIMGFMNPFAVGAGLTSLMAADEITNEASDGKYLNFTQFTIDKLGPVAGTIVGMTPGIIGGGAAAKATYAPSYTTNARIIERDPSLIKETILDVNKNIVNYKPKPTSTRYYTKTNPQPGKTNYTLYNANGEPAGILKTESAESAGTTGNHIEWVNSYGKNHGVSEDLYNVAVRDAKKLVPGLESGLDLLMADVTKAVTSKFPHEERMIGTPLIVKDPITGNYKLEQAIPGRLLTGNTGKPMPVEAPEGHFLLYSEPIKRSTDATSLEFYLRPSKLTEGERLGITKGLERFLVDNQQQILQNAREFAKKYGYDIPETIDAAKNMYRLHNRWFRTVTIDPFIEGRLSKEFNSAKFAPELQGMSDEQVAKILATRGYPDAFKTGDLNNIGLYSSESVFASPSMKANSVYLGNTGSKTVMLQRPFTLRNPLNWHIDADYKPISRYDFITKPGQTQIGNAGPSHEIKLSTQHLIPVKIAQPGDKGTLLGNYMGNIIYKSGGKLNYLNYFS